MTELLDGPAAGVALMLRRSPLFLRVTCSPRGNWDALDQLADEPRPRETVYAYRRVGRSRGLVCVRGKGRGCYPMVSYRVVEPQPPDEVLRDTARWRAWATAEWERIKAAAAAEKARES